MMSVNSDVSISLSGAVTRWWKCLLWNGRKIWVWMPSTRIKAGCDSECLCLQKWAAQRQEDSGTYWSASLDETANAGFSEKLIHTCTHACTTSACCCIPKRETNTLFSKQKGKETNLSFFKPALIYSRWQNSHGLSIFHSSSSFNNTCTGDYFSNTWFLAEGGGMHLNHSKYILLRFW